MSWFDDQDSQAGGRRMHATPHGRMGAPLSPNDQYLRGLPDDTLQQTLANPMAPGFEDQVRGEVQRRATASAPAGPTMPSGIDPRLAALYQQHGITPADRGTGFADWQYWNDKPDQFGRLDADLSGTGTDQPTGTPGQGPWQRSGAQDRGGQMPPTFAQMMGGPSQFSPSPMNPYSAPPPSFARQAPNFAQLMTTPPPQYVPAPQQPWMPYQMGRRM